MGRDPQRTQEQRRGRSQAALVAAAAELVVESGVRAVTLAGVGQRAGYSRGIVTHHFGSKRGLLDAVARDIQGGFVPGLDDLPPGLERLLMLVDGYIGALSRPGVHVQAFLLLWAESTTDAELAPTFRARDETFRADIRADVEAGKAAGSIRADVRPDLTAVAMLAQLRGIGLQRLLDPDAVDVEALRRTVTDSWTRALRPDVD